MKTIAKEHPVDHATRYGPLGLRVIGAYKVVKALLLIVVGCEILHLLKNDVADGLERWILVLRLDPDNRYVHGLISRLAGIDRQLLKQIGFGTFFYALLDGVEGVGLWLRRPWAEYLTVIATASLLPLEGYEIYRKLSAARIAVLLFNLAIVSYLIYRLREDRPSAAARWHATAPLPAPDSSH